MSPHAEAPVDDAVPVEEHEGERHLGRVEPGPWLVELARPLDLKHEIAAVDVLHDEEETVLQTFANCSIGRTRTALCG